jgi:hypothetical protein
VAGSTVRLFTKTRAEAGELGVYLGKVLVEPSGAWKATFAKQPTGTLIAATQTGSDGGTSEVSAPVSAAADPVEPEQQGGGTSGGGTVSSSSSGAPTPAPAPAKPTTPKVKITKGPKKTSEATKATFKFTATPATGATFECKFDATKWAKCRSPKTYKHLQSGRHTFQVRAGVPGAPTSKPAKLQFTVKP